MGSLTYDESELLNFFRGNDNVGLLQLEQAYEMSKRSEYLAKHNHSIWLGSDNFYNTILEINGEKKRLRRKELKKLEDIIIEHYREKLENPTFREIYEDWISDKLERGEICQTTKNRYDNDYKLCFLGFGERRIKSFTRKEIEDFILQSISDKQLTVKGYGNMRGLLYGVFKRAKRCGYIDYSITQIVKDLEISPKAFRREHKEVSELVFSEDETKVMLDYLTFNHKNPKDLGILLTFKTGIRPGELAALRPQDIYDDHIHVSSTEIRWFDEDLGIFNYEVRDFPKTEAGIRDVFVSKKNQWLLEEIKLRCINKPYAFMNNTQRIKTCQFDDRLRYLCSKLNLPPKSLNKIRKTYATILLDNNVEESVITAQMGHTDISTTKRYYYKLRKSRIKRVEILDRVVDL